MAISSTAVGRRVFSTNAPDNKIHGANMGLIWGRQDPGGPHVGPMNFAIWGINWPTIYRTCMSNVIIVVKPWDVTISPCRCHIFNGGLTKPSVKFEYEWINTSHRNYVVWCSACRCSAVTSPAAVMTTRLDLFWPEFLEYHVFYCFRWPDCVIHRRHLKTSCGIVSECWKRRLSCQSNQWSNDPRVLCQKVDRIFTIRELE